MTTIDFNSEHPTIVDLLDAGARVFLNVTFRRNLPPRVGFSAKLTPDMPLCNGRSARGDITAALAALERDVARQRQDSAAQSPPVASEGSAAGDSPSKIKTP